jgi:hypothetical protein
MAACQRHARRIGEPDHEHADAHDDKEHAEQSIGRLLIRISEPARYQKHAHRDVKDRKEREERGQSGDHVMKHGE